MKNQTRKISNFLLVLGIILGIPMLIVTFLISGYFVYCEYSYKIEDRITEGNGYRFNIGMSKEESLSPVDEHLEDYSKELSVFYEKGKSIYATGAMLEIFAFPLSEDKKVRLFSTDTWHITFSEKKSYFDQIELKFENGNLFMIERRRHCEYP